MIKAGAINEKGVMMAANEILWGKLAHENVSFYPKILVDISWQNCRPFHVTSLLTMATLGGMTQTVTFLFVSSHLWWPRQEGLGQYNIGIGIIALHNCTHFHWKLFQLKDSFFDKEYNGECKS